MKTILLLFLSLLLYLPAVAQSKCISGVRLEFEQDFLLEYMGLSNLNTDRNYTQGAGIALYSDKFTEKWISHRSRITEHIRVYQPTEFGFQFAGFTPDELRDTFPIIGDRPYSTIFFINLKFSYLEPENYLFRQRGFYFGMLGVDGPAENLQTKIHKKTNENNTRPPYFPMGWHNQISNGGEPTIMYSEMYSRLCSHRDQLANEIRNGAKNNNTGALLSWNYGYSLGYITQATAGFTAKVGKFDLANWHSDLFNLTGLIASAPPVAAQFTENQVRHYYDSLRKKSECYLFLSLNGNATLYNGSLHGQFKETAYRLPYSQTGFLNAQARTGIGYSSQHFSAAVYWAFKSPEMWNSYYRVHSWGGVVLSTKW